MSVMTLLVIKYMKLDEIDTLDKGEDSYRLVKIV